MARKNNGKKKDFFCPILHKREKTEVIKGHIINKAIRGPGITIPQRKDVDSFFGEIEADFVLMLKNQGKEATDMAFSKPTEGGNIPKLYANGREQKYYTVPHNKGIIPDGYSRVPFFPQSYKPGGRDVVITSLYPPETLRFEVDLACTWQTLVSLIKAAHLTLVYLLGDRYIQSASGYFVGHDILGIFYEKVKEILDKDTVNKKRKEIVAALAVEYFSEFQNMVRPLTVPIKECVVQGTLIDRHFYICTDSKGNSPWWAMMVFVATPPLLSAILIPSFDDALTAGRFMDTMHSSSDMVLYTRNAHWERENPAPWSIGEQIEESVWPKSDFEQYI